MDTRPTSPILRADKRYRNETGGSESQDEFTTVVRNPKRLARSYSHIIPTRDNKENGEQSEQYDICITSKEALPKQIAFARFLDSIGIPGILNINPPLKY